MDIRILLVDDEVDFIETVLKRFTFRKIPAKAVHNGQDALDLLAREPIDVVILDVRMPGLDGIETLKEIKKRHPLVEVIMLTGHASIETGMQGMTMGAYDYILKPTDFDLLLDKVRKAFERKKINEKQSGRT